MSSTGILRHTSRQSLLEPFLVAVAPVGAPAFVVEIAYFAISGLWPPQLTKSPTSVTLPASTPFAPDQTLSARRIKGFINRRRMRIWPQPLRCLQEHPTKVPSGGYATRR